MTYVRGAPPLFGSPFVYHIKPVRNNSSLHIHIAKKRLQWSVRSLFISSFNRQHSSKSTSNAFASAIT